MDSLISFFNSYGIGEREVVWILIGLFILFFVLLLFLYILLIPKYRKYTKDRFYDVEWRWKWKKDKVISLWCYCPKCGSELLCDDENCKNSHNLKEKITFFICQKCNESEQGRVVGGDRSFALKMVEREIAKKVSNKTFQVEQDGV